MRSPDEAKFRTIRSTSKLLTEGQRRVGRDVMEALLVGIGFCAVFDGDENASPTSWCFSDVASDGFGDCRGRLMEADRLLSDCEQVLSDDAASCESRVVPVPLLPSKAEGLLKSKEAEKRKLADSIVEAARRDAQAVKIERERELAFEATAKAQRDSDVACVAHLVDVARRTIHMTGRLRNASFEAKHFELRVMRHGRGFACSCPNDHLEAHWHVVNASILYAYVVHLTPDASKVVHVGHDQGYQYNSVPGTESFGETLWMSTKWLVDAPPTTPTAAPSVDMTAGPHAAASKRDEAAAATVQTVHIEHRGMKPVTSCIYCGVPFRLLFL